MSETTKRLVVCCDGTWNSPERHHVTNVVRSARAVLPTDGQGVSQVVFYDWGIGSYGNRIRGGMLGVGMDKNIQDAYRFLVHNIRMAMRFFFSVSAVAPIRRAASRASFAMPGC